MGRIKTLMIKRLSLQLLERYRTKFTEDFDKNKVIVGQLTDTDSMKIRNSVAGYITRLVKRGGEEKRPYVAKRDYEIQG